MKKEMTPEEHWAAISAEIGEDVRAYALARLLMHGEPANTGFLAPRQEWGLVFLTDTTLYIEQGASENWLARLISSRRSPEAPERIAIRIGSITKLTMPQEKTGIGKLFAGPEMTVDLEYNGGTQKIGLVLDRRGSNDLNLIDLLSAACGENA